MSTSLEERVDRLEQLVSNMFKAFGKETSGLSQNDAFLADALVSHDNFLGALRLVLVGNKTLTNQQLDDALAKVSQMRAEREMQQKQQAEQQAEMLDLRDRALAAAEGPEFPKEAFIFGG